MKTESKAGRPPLYETPEALESKAELYFGECDSTERPYTVAGLVYYLGFEDRHSLAEQQHREGFSATVKRIRLRIEARKNEMLISTKGNVTGLIFDLKNNHGWRDKQDMDVTTSGESLNDGPSQEALARAKEEIRKRLEFSFIDMGDLPN